MVFSLTWLPEVLEAAGLKMAEQPGWRTRGHGDVSPIKGMVVGGGGHKVEVSVDVGLEGEG